jgi:peroxidase
LIIPSTRCIQKNPLFPFDPHTNPVLCELVPEPTTIPWKIILGTTLALVIGYLIIQWFRSPKYTPPTTWGYPVIGSGQQLQKDPKGFLVQQAQKYGSGRTFGIRLVGSLVYYICSSTTDLEVMKNDELRASFHSLAEDTNLGAVVGRKNFQEELHASVIRRKLETERSETLPRLAEVVSETVDAWLAKNPLTDTPDISGALTKLMAYVMSRVCLGREGFDDPELLEAYLGLNTDSGIVFQVSNLLPSFIGRLFSDWKVHEHYSIIKKKILPVIKRRRKLQTAASVNQEADDILGFFLDVTDDDTRTAELVAGIVIGGLINVSIGVTNALYDVVEVEGLQGTLQSNAPANQFIPDGPSDSSWNPLRSAVLETLRLSACVFGPVRKIIVRDFKLGSDPKLELPVGSGMAASPYVSPRKDDLMTFHHI